MKPVKGQVAIRNELVCPYRRLWDPDNFNKAVLDALQKSLIIQGDDHRYIRSITACVGDGQAGATVTIEALGVTI